jgi:mono/diheme cytochrome c family protein
MSGFKVSRVSISLNARSRMHSRSWTIQFAAWHLFVILLSAVALCARAQTASHVQSDNTLYAEIAKAPVKATARPNPMEHDRDALLAGQKLYERHCAECHGETGEGGSGSKKGPSLRAPEVQQATAGALFWVLTNGVVRRGMPVWSKLPEPQRWQLVTYIKSLSGPAKTQRKNNDSASAGHPGAN